MIAVLGAGPHGRELAEIAVRVGFEPWFFDDDRDMFGVEGGIGRYRDLIPPPPFVIGAAWPEIRREINDKVCGLPAAVLVDPEATTSASAELAGGVCVAAGARVGPGVRVGAHTHLGLNSTVSRDCQLGGFVTLCPGVHVAGGVVVEDDVFVGIGAVVVHELVVGRGALIGAGAVVVEDVKPFTTVVGNPARPLR